MTPATTVTDSHDAAQPRARSRRALLRAGATGSVVAMALVAAVHTAARFAGDELKVAAPGQPTGSVPVGLAVGAAAVGALLAVVAAAAAVRTPRPRAVFTGVALAGLVASFVSPFAAASTSPTAWWLASMHVAVAVAMVPALRRVLPAVTR